MNTESVETRFPDLVDQAEREGIRDGYFTTDAAPRIRFDSPELQRAYERGFRQFPKVAP